MNLKAYYQKIHAIENGIAQPFVVLVSHETPDGGKEGLLTEAPKGLAAKMIADGRAHLANDDASRVFQEKKAQAKRMAEGEVAASRTQATLAPTADPVKVKRSTKE